MTEARDVQIYLADILKNLQPREPFETRTVSLGRCKIGDLSDVAEAPYGGPIYRVFKRVLDKNFAVGYLLLALVNGVLGGIVGYFVV